MPRLLVLYGSTDGQTRKIAGAIATIIRAEGHSVDLVEAPHFVAAPRPSDYDGVIVAASLHLGNYQRAVKRWVRAHACELNVRPSAFISVCLAILEERLEAREEVHKIRSRFLKRSGWQPTISKDVAGAVPYTRYHWFKKWVMKRIMTKTGGGTDTSRDYEYTDWDDVRSFACAFAAFLTTRATDTPPLEEVPA